MTYIQLICSLCESDRLHGRPKIFLLNGHGGNDVPLHRRALRELAKPPPRGTPGVRFVYASYWTLAAKTLREVRESEFGGIGHACEMETSIMLHLCPHRVKMNLAQARWPDAHRHLPQSRHAVRSAGLFRQRIPRGHHKRCHRPPRIRHGRKRKTLPRRHRERSRGIRRSLWNLVKEEVASC